MLPTVKSELDLVNRHAEEGQVSGRWCKSGKMGLGALCDGTVKSEL